MLGLTRNNRCLCRQPPLYIVAFQLGEKLSLEKKETLFLMSEMHY